MRKIVINNSEIRVTVGNITTIDCECIVNAANKSLCGGGGVDGAIHRAAGAELLEECRELGGCNTGEAKITKGYRLKAKYIIHTVGPVYSEKESDATDLRNCYYNSLVLAKENNIHSIAFPSISTGAYRYPVDKAAVIATETVMEFLNDNQDYKMQVIFCCFDQKNYDEYIKWFQKEEAAAKREYAKFCILNANGNKKKMNKGLRLLKEAYEANDHEAVFLMGKLMLDGYIKPNQGDVETEAMKILYYASRQGSLQARVLLNQLSDERYRNQNNNKNVTAKKESHPLTDFDGKPFVIKRTGIFTPIDAVLEYKDNKNILTFKAVIDFINIYEAKNQELFMKAVIRGIKEWEGEYTVFGGQQLTVKMDITSKSRLFDTVNVFLINDESVKKLEKFEGVLDKIGNDNVRKELNNIISNKTSFAVTGLKWSVKSNKSIFINHNEEGENTYEKIAALAKHEFGHALGLGDLYKNPQKGLLGVAHGKYDELDAYMISDKFYNLVMCDSGGVISNNDIEMVVLAFSENAKQNYQMRPGERNVSKALGRGN